MFDNNCKHLVFIALSILLIQSCKSNFEPKYCYETQIENHADTLVFENKIDGVIHKDCNFIIVTDKYLEGYTDQSSKRKVYVTLYSKIDSTKRKVEAFILKSNEYGVDFIDYIRYVLDESAHHRIDRTLPYIIHPVTGKYIRIRDGLVTRNTINKSFATQIERSAEKIVDWTQNEWEEDALINYTIEFKGKIYFNNCNRPENESVSNLLKEFGIVNIYRN